MIKTDNTYKCKYFEFTPEWTSLSINYYLSKYDESGAMLQIYLIWGKLFLYLPWKHYKKVKREKTALEIRKDKLDSINNKKFKSKDIYIKKEYVDDEPHIYGFYFCARQLGIHIGTHVHLYDLPWYYKWIRTSALSKDCKTWYNETKNNRNMEFYNTIKWKDILFIETHPYEYTTKNGNIQHCLATIRVEEREWRWKWLTWLKITRKVSKDLCVDFNDDIGERKGTWKGGVTGCGYKMNKGETPYDTLKRMERDRKF